MYLYQNQSPLYQKIEIMKKESKVIERTITTLTSVDFTNQLELKRLANKKKSLSDEISRLENSVIPNIIA